MPFLLKTEPDVYSFDDLQRDKETIWDGVTSPQGVKFLREMEPKETLVIYHTGGVRVAVGTASVVHVDAADPKVPLVKIRCGESLAKPKSLAQIKACPLFADSLLVRIGRLSVVPLTAAQYQWLLASK